MELDPQSVRNFNSLIDEMAKETGADMDKVTRNTARDLTFQLIGNTPAARKGTKNRGQAKQGWVEVSKDLGKTPRASFPGGSNAAKRFHQTTIDKANGRVRYELSNSTPFIEELDQGTGRRKPANILQKSFDKTNKIMAKRLDKIIARNMAKRWKK